MNRIEKLRKKLHKYHDGFIQRVHKMPETERKIRINELEDTKVAILTTFPDVIVADDFVMYRVRDLILSLLGDRIAYIKNPERSHED